MLAHEFSGLGFADLFLELLPGSLRCEKLAHITMQLCTQFEVVLKKT